MANIQTRDRSQTPTTTRSREWERMIRDVFGWDPFAQMTPAGTRGYYPSFDVRETNESYTFEADLPGVKDSDIDVSVTGNRLTIAGSRSFETKKEDDRWFSCERSFGSFSRSFTLPEGVDGDTVRADFQNGVLTVVVPKKPEIQPRKVELNKGGEAH